MHATRLSSTATQALKDRDIILFNSLLQECNADGKKVVNPDHQYGDPHHATCLYMACKERDYEEFIVALLAAGADPNHVNPIRNKSSLHVATFVTNHLCLSQLNMATIQQ
jgi:hypothetical protein